MAKLAATKPNLTANTLSQPTHPPSSLSPVAMVSYITLLLQIADHTTVSSSSSTITYCSLIMKAHSSLVVVQRTPELQ
jgi:hypothetical protein